MLEKHFKALIAIFSNNDWIWLLEFGCPNSKFLKFGHRCRDERTERTPENSHHVWSYCKIWDKIKIMKTITKLIDYKWVIFFNYVLVEKRVLKLFCWY